MATKKMISVNVDDELLEAIDDTAEKLGISRSSVMNMALRGVFLGETAAVLKTLASSAIARDGLQGQQSSENAVLA